MARRIAPAGSATAPDLAPQVLETWRRANDILLALLAGVPEDGFGALPTGSRGRTVALQFAHLDRVRREWLEYHLTGKQARLPRADKTRPPTPAELKQALRESGKDVADYLARALRGEEKTRMFGGQPVRWMAYLIAHEAHHRGQILLALKQSGHRMSDKVALEGMWGSWMSS